MGEILGKFQEKLGEKMKVFRNFGKNLRSSLRIFDKISGKFKEVFNNFKFYEYSVEILIEVYRNLN